MNILQVGRPAVSRYPNKRKFYMIEEGVNYVVHDWPTAELGLKLRGHASQRQLVRILPKRKCSARTSSRILMKFDSLMTSLDGSISLSPLYPNQTNDLHVSIATSLHQSFPWLHPVQA